MKSFYISSRYIYLETSTLTVYCTGPHYIIVIVIALILDDYFVRYLICHDGSAFVKV